MASGSTRVAVATLVVAALSVVSMTTGANAQGMGGFGGGHRHQQKTDKSAQQKPPQADEKAYQAALKSLPNKPNDPWRGAR
ncbi:MAG TPA: hypothetical protein VGJ20_36005 [Xanthobacteraceae bacterium]|jgi:hypothetical protein